MGLNGDRVRRARLVLAGTDAAGSLIEFLSATTRGLDEYLGFRESAFMLTLADNPRAYAGIKHGSPDYVLEEYFERWADDDALGSDAARHMFASTGWATISDLYRHLDAPRRRFVDDFLVRVRARCQLSVRLPGRLTDGYITVMGPSDFDPRDRTALLALAPELGERLARWLPAGLEPSGMLSPRERQTCELVALGFTNREIASILHLEEDTAKKYVSRALSELGLRNRTELAVAWATGRRLDVTRSVCNGARSGNGPAGACAGPL